MRPLTKRQHALLEYLRSCDECPSYAEMRDALGVTSKSEVHRLVSALEERGFIRRLPNRARAIEIVDNSRLPRFTVHELVREAENRGLVIGYLHGPRMEYFEKIPA